ncbi:glycosyltransferase family 2 protein [Daejeonia sp. YH14]|uniref:glycosyltransferase family 2 protein n=1 Tax=Daejeonia sp. YH14 TaxID=3439042 RepID=UPI003F497390
MLFTIGLPAYKAQFFRECLESILHQTFDDFEVVILNDASPEPIRDIVNGYSDRRIVYTENKENVGAYNIVDNWNKILSMAKGEFFVMMGDDDVLLPNYLQQFASLISKYNAANVFHCRTMIIDENSEFVELTETRPEMESVFDSIWARIEKNRTQFISDFVYRREALINNGGFIKIPLAWASDDITSYIAAIDGGIVHTNEVLFQYRRSSINISASIKNTEDKIRAVDSEKQWIDKIVNMTNISSDDDFLVRKMIVSRLDIYVLKKKMLLVSKTIVAHPFSSFIKFISKRKDLGLPFNLVLYALIEAIKVRMTAKQSVKK